MRRSVTCDALVCTVQNAIVAAACRKQCTEIRQETLSSYIFDICGPSVGEALVRPCAVLESYS